MPSLRRSETQVTEVVGTDVESTTFGMDLSFIFYFFKCWLSCWLFLNSVLVLIIRILCFFIRFAGIFRFVYDNLFGPFPIRAYADPCEKWQLVVSCLKHFKMWVHSLLEDIVNSSNWDDLVILLGFCVISGFWPCMMLERKILMMLPFRHSLQLWLTWLLMYNLLYWNWWKYVFDTLNFTLSTTIVVAWLSGNLSLLISYL